MSSREPSQCSLGGRPPGSTKSGRRVRSSRKRHRRPAVQVQSVSRRWRLSRRSPLLAQWRRSPGSNRTELSWCSRSGADAAMAGGAGSAARRSGMKPFVGFANSMLHRSGGNRQGRCRTAPGTRTCCSATPDRSLLVSGRSGRGSRRRSARGRALTPGTIAGSRGRSDSPRTAGRAAPA